MRQFRRHRRRGFVLLAVLVIFGIALVTLSVLLQHLLRQERETKSLLHTFQAQALAESALDRAVAKLHGDRKYAGETWQPAISTAAGNSAARVTIAVKPADKENQFEVTVTSLFPDHPTRRVQVVCQRQINLRASE